METKKIRPGDLNDLRLSLEIHKLNKQFKGVNFGQTIDHSLLEQRRPAGLEEYD